MKLTLREELEASLIREMGVMDMDKPFHKRASEAALKVFREWLGSEEAVNMAEDVRCKWRYPKASDPRFVGTNGERDLRAMGAALASLTEASK